MNTSNSENQNNEIEINEMGYGTSYKVKKQAFDHIEAVLRIVRSNPVDDIEVYVDLGKRQSKICAAITLGDMKTYGELIRPFRWFVGQHFMSHPGPGFIEVK